MAKKEYISVNSTTNQTNQLVKLVNHDNEFTGKIMSAGSNGGAQDVRDLFIAELRVDGEQVEETIESNKRIVNIHVPDVTPVNPTKVFKANDPTGTTPVDNLSLTPSAQPSTGDILIVTHELSSGKHENSAYIYENGWQACNGNVDASKVILTDNLQMQGMYERVGNFVNDGSEVEARGMSVQDLLKTMFYKELPPAVYFIGDFTTGETLDTEDVQELALWQIESDFQSFDALPDEFEVTDARQVLLIAPQSETRTLVASTKNNLPYTVTKLKVGSRDLTINVNNKTFVVWQIFEGSKFTDKIKFAWE